MKLATKKGCVKMRVCIIGYGVMGRMVEELAKSKGYEVKAIISPHAEGATHKEISAEALRDVDVCIDFSVPNAVVGNVRKVLELGKKVVVGTTGWYDRLGEVKDVVEQCGGGLVYAPNFSLGVGVFYYIVEAAAKLMNTLPWYDVGCFEVHHNHKVDSPSGTAKKLGELLLKNIERKKKVLYDRLNRKIEPDELHIASLRCGEAPSTHVVLFDSAYDFIELKHENRNRAGLAAGAVLAAEWILDKKGFFTFDDVVKEKILSGR